MPSIHCLMIKKMREKGERQLQEEREGKEKKEEEDEKNK